MRIQWTPEARAQLRAIHEHIAQESPKIAQQVIERVLSRCGRLADLPRSGRKVPDYNRDDLRELSVRPYRLIYRVMEEQVDIISVMHVRRLLPRDWKRLGKSTPNE
jgi:addiction module RelE/StbE family toxin